MNETNDQNDFLAITADVVASYLSNNQANATDIPSLIASVHEAFVKAARPEAEPQAEAPKPAVSVRKSIQEDFLVSLEDGKKYKTLKRHLAGLGMTPDEYRAKWGLPKDYPMVAPSYARRRSELAKATGLGQKRRKAEPAPPAAPEPAKKTRGRKKAA